jgi:hypothetical protein
VRRRGPCGGENVAKTVEFLTVFRRAVDRKWSFCKAVDCAVCGLFSGAGTSGRRLALDSLRGQVLNSVIDRVISRNPAASAMQ